MPPRRSVALTGAVLGLLLAFTVFRPTSSGGPIERDFEAYYAAGATVDAGGDPYARGIWRAERRVPGVNAAHDELLPFVGPAAALPLWGLLARLPYPAAVVVWTLALLAAFATIVGAAVRLAGAPADPWLWTFAAIMAAASAPMIGSLALGQAALPSAAGVAAAIVAYRNRHAPAAIGATLLAALQPNVTLALIARIRSRWDALVATSAALVFAAATLAFGGGFAGARGYLRHLGEHGAAERFAAIQHTPAAIAYAAGLAPPAAIVAGTLVAGAALIAAIVIIRRERLDATMATLVAGALLPLALPFFHEQDFVIEVVPLAILALRATGTARLLGAAAAVLTLVDWFGLAQRSGAQGQILALGAVVACAFAGAGRPERSGQTNVAGIALLAIVGAIAVPLARAHPAPTWPDQLPRHFHAQPRADPSLVWGAEQRAAGLMQRDPVWPALRAIPLTGCVVLTWALVADTRRRRRLTAPITDRDGPGPAPAEVPPLGAGPTARLYDEAIPPR